MLTTVKKLALLAVVTTSLALVADSKSASAADHQESPALALAGASDALMLDILDWLGIEPIDLRDGPMPQTREHILLARIVPPSAAGPLELQIYRLNRRQARLVIWILLILEDHHDPEPAAFYFIKYVKQTKTFPPGY